MLIAFAGASGRTDAVHASLLAALAFAAADRVATYVAADDNVAPPEGSTLRVVPVAARASAAVLAEVAAACRADRSVGFVAVEPGVLSEAAARAAIDVAVVAVGPHLSDERAASRIGKASPAPTWHLGCRRPGGEPAARRFAAGMAELDRLARTLPCVLPPFGRAEAEGLLHGRPGCRALEAGVRLLEALRPVAGAAGAGLTLAAGGRTRGKGASTAPDQRGLADRLRELADDIEAAEAGLAPSAADLAGAPVLDRWDYAVIPTPVLTGLVTGHPNIADNRPARTTEVFLTDRATYARTLSRWYALRTPAGTAAPNLQ